MPISKKWVLAKRKKSGSIDGENDFHLKDEQTPELRKGEILCRAIFLSIDPIVRLYMAYGRENEVIPGRQVARVVESKNKDFPKGKVRP